MERAVRITVMMLIWVLWGDLAVLICLAAGVISLPVNLYLLYESLRKMPAHRPEVGPKEVSHA